MEQSYCGKCGHSNIVGSQLCHKCGDLLENQVAFLRLPGEELPLTCPKCNTVNAPGAQTCVRCNTRLSEQNATNQVDSLIGGAESNGRTGGRIKLEPSLFGEENSKSKSTKAPSRLAQAAAKRERDKTGEDPTPDWLAALRDNAIPTTPKPIPAPTNDNSFQIQEQDQPKTFLSQVDTAEDFQASTSPENKEQATPAEAINQENNQIFEPLVNANEIDQEVHSPVSRFGTSDLPEWLADLKPASKPDILPQPETAEEQPVELDLSAIADTDLTVFDPTSLSGANKPGKSTKPVESSAPEPGQKVQGTEELGLGMPDWLKDIANKEKTSEPTGPFYTGSRGGKNTLPTSSLGSNENIPDWLREAATGGSHETNTTFGDIEVERTLNFAFDENDSFAPNLPPTESGYGQRSLEMPAVEVRKGLTDELKQLPVLETDTADKTQNTSPAFYNPIWTDADAEKYAAYAAEDEIAGLTGTKEWEELEPFSGITDGELHNDEEEHLENIEIENGQADTESEKLPPWGEGLAPWLIDAQLPVLESVAEDQLEPAQSSTLSTSTQVDENSDWLEETASEPENLENPLIGDIREQTSSTRSFSLREMLHQTESLAAKHLESDRYNFEADTTSEAENTLELPTWLENQAAFQAEHQPENDVVQPESLGHLSPLSSFANDIEVNNQAGNSASVEPEKTPENIELASVNQKIADNPDSLVSSNDNIATLSLSQNEEDVTPPDWLQNMMSGGKVEPVNTYGSTGPKQFSSYTPMGGNSEGLTDELPEWLRDTLQSSNEAESETAPEPSETLARETSGANLSSSNQSELSLDNLFGNIAEDETAKGSGSPELPEWLNEQPKTVAPIIEVPQDLPDWLRDSENNKDFATTQSEGQSSTFEVKTPETPNFGGIAASDFLSDSDVPSWLRTINAPQSGAAKIPITPTSETINPNALPSWLRAVGSATSEETNTEEVNQPLNIGLPLVEVPATLAGAAVLSSLLRYTPSPVETSAAVSSRNKLSLGLFVRLLSFVALIGVILLGLLSPISTSRPTITPQVQNFYNSVEALNAGQKVLVVYDWEADKGGEMKPMAQAITAHLLNKRADLVTLSLNPQGPVLADQVTTELINNPVYGNNQNGVYDYGKGYLNLGFVPGNEAAVRSLFSNLNTLSDYKNGRPASDYPLMSGLKSLTDFNLVVVLAGDETNVRTWIEQFGITPNSKLLLGVPNSVGPMAQPYAFAPPSANINLQGQLVRPQGLIIGLSGATQYQQLLQDSKNLPTDTNISLSQRLTAQSLGALLLVVIIVVANIVYILRKRD